MTKDNKKTISGTVVGIKMKDTSTVLVERYVKHPKYQKFMKTSKKFQVHDAGNSAKLGEKVEIKETKPISKSKRFTLVKDN